MQNTARRDLPIVLGLLLAVGAVYGQTLWHDFVLLDDRAYVVENARVRAGLSWGGARWALTALAQSNWHPLTWMSHMLDVSLWGLWPGGHHLTNLLLHAANAILLYIFLQRVTGCRGRSAAVAALFALHPLRVESVAWVAERKDLLCGFFWMLTLLAYARYRGTPRSPRTWYALTLALFACALMSKPMAVTLPVVLLVLALWPLQMPRRRGRWQHARALAPFFALALASAVMTLIAQRSAMTGLGGLPGLQRVENAMVSVVAYLGKLAWPAALTSHYAYRHEIPRWQVLGALVLLAAISVLAWRWRARRPYVAAGWLWFLVTLAPVIGVIQVGDQRMADRYLYLPAIGIFWIGVWLVADWAAARGRALRLAVAAAGGVALLALAALSARQAATWRDSEALYRQAVAVDGRDAFARLGLAQALVAAGRPAEALPHFAQARAIGTHPVETDLDEAITLLVLGRAAEAEARVAAVLAGRPEHGPAHRVLGDVRMQQGRPGEAAEAYRAAMAREPGRALLRAKLASAEAGVGIALARGGRLDEAIVAFREAVRLGPASAGSRYNLALALARTGREGEAREALNLFGSLVAEGPEHAQYHSDLAWVRATHPVALVRDGVEAVRLAERAVSLNGGRDPSILDTLAAAYAEAGRYDAAVAQARGALALADARGERELAEAIRARLAVYGAGQPFRETLWVGEWEAQ